MKCALLSMICGAGIAAAILSMAAADSPEEPRYELHIVAPDQLRWTNPPPGAARGAPSLAPGGPLRYASINGDPLKPGAPFTIRLKCGDGYRVAPHWHPVDENIIVLRGGFAVASGNTFDPSRTRAIPAGGYGFIPARLHHFAVCKGETEMIMYGVGPRLNYWVISPSK
jgi:hypothetical protein